MFRKCKEAFVIQLVGLLVMRSLVAVVIAANLFTGLLGLAFWLFVVARFANWRGSCDLFLHSLVCLSIVNRVCNIGKRCD